MIDGRTFDLILSQLEYQQPWKVSLLQVFEVLAFWLWMLQFTFTAEMLSVRLDVKTWWMLWHIKMNGPLSAIFSKRERGSLESLFCTFRSWLFGEKLLMSLIISGFVRLVVDNGRIFKSLSPELVGRWEENPQVSWTAVWGPWIQGLFYERLLKIHLCFKVVCNLTFSGCKGKQLEKSIGFISLKKIPLSLLETALSLKNKNKTRSYRTIHC